VDPQNTSNGAKGNGKVRILPALFQLGGGKEGRRGGVASTWVLRRQNASLFAMAAFLSTREAAIDEHILHNAEAGGSDGACRTWALVCPYMA
jgi:hypothetical protein